MENSFGAWSDCAADLVAVAAGRRPADLVILGGQLANVHTREILPWDVAIAAGRFAYVGPDASHCIGPDTEVLRWGGYVIPGLCDGHMHVESGMLTPAEFARAVTPYGTTTMFTDPHAIACGCDPMVALQMATINTATHFGLERELGSIAPGRRADVIFTSDLRALPIDRVIARGKTVALEGQITTECPHIDWPATARNTVHMGAKKSAAEFTIPAPDEGGEVAQVRVIGVVENQAPTQALQAELPVRGGRICGQGDICQIALVERHRARGTVTNGFVSGFGYRGEMAIASTVAHDSHHMIVVGTCAEHMARAANRLAEVGGGVSVWKDGRELALVELPIAGLMSDAPAAEVAAKAEAMVQAMADCGCHLNNAYMQHSLLALVVIPDLRISDLGLVDVRKFEIVPVVQEGSQEDASA